MKIPKNIQVVLTDVGPIKRAVEETFPWCELTTELRLCVYTLTPAGRKRPLTNQDHARVIAFIQGYHTCVRLATKATGQ
jgi:hypothetical protein